MTSRPETMPTSLQPTDAAHRLLARLCAAASGVLVAGLALVLVTAPLSGCEQEPEPEVVVAPPPKPPPPPPPPAVPSIAQLMKELGISDKIRLPEEKAPATEVQRVAVLKFFDGFAKGTPDAIKGAMGEEDRVVLDLMQKSGELGKAIGTIDRIDLTTASVEGKMYVMAVYRTGPSFQPQLWQFKVDGEGRKIDSQTFDSYIQPLDVMNKISGANLIAEWIKLVAAERKLAEVPDETFRPPARVQAEEKSEEPQAGGGSAPSGPIGAPPMRNRPTGPPLKPPGPGGPGGPG